MLSGAAPGEAREAGRAGDEAAQQRELVLNAELGRRLRRQCCATGSAHGAGVERGRRRAAPTSPSTGVSRLLVASIAQRARVTARKARTMLRRVCEVELMQGQPLAEQPAGGEPVAHGLEVLDGV